MESKDLYFKRTFLSDRDHDWVYGNVQEYTNHNNLPALDIEFILSDGSNRTFFTSWGDNKSDNLELISQLKVISKTLTELISVVEGYYAEV